MQPTDRSYIPLRGVNWPLVAGFFGLNLVCLFFYRQLDYVASGVRRPARLTLLEETAGTTAGLLIFPLAYLAAIRFPLPAKCWRRNIMLHLLTLCGISVLHTTAIAALRALFFPLFGYENHYGYLPARYPMEFAHLFIYYWFGLSLIYFFHELRFAQQRELREARLEASLSEAKLQNLRLQLEPHFLFNALNSISAAIYDDPRSADEMIGRLGELLRQVLKNDTAQEITLEQEIELLSLYAAVMKARWEDRFEMAVSIDDSAKRALIPQLLLQPLIENSVRHGMDDRFTVRIRIEAHCLENRLALTIRDRGPGIDPLQPVCEGIGIRNTTERLQRLYGNRHSFTLGNAEDGGAEVKIELPLQKQMSKTIISEVGAR